MGRLRFLLRVLPRFPPRFPVWFLLRFLPRFLTRLPARSLLRFLPRFPARCSRSSSSRMRRRGQRWWRSPPAGSESLTPPNHQCPPSSALQSSLSLFYVLPPFLLYFHPPCPMYLPYSLSLPHLCSSYPFIPNLGCFAVGQEQREFWGCFLGMLGSSLGGLQPGHPQCVPSVFQGSLQPLPGDAGFCGKAKGTRCPPSLEEPPCPPRAHPAPSPA